MRWILEAHTGELGYSLEDLSDLFGIEPEEMREMYPVDRPKPRLRLVV